jgi:hypothetical protein
MHLFLWPYLLERNISDAEVFLEQSCLSKNPAAFLHISSILNNRFEDLCNTKYDQSPKVVGDIAFNNRSKGTTKKTKMERIDLEKLFFRKIFLSSLPTRLHIYHLSHSPYNPSTILAFDSYHGQCLL